MIGIKIIDLRSEEEMLAVVKEHGGPGFSVKDVPYPELRSDDVIIKVSPLLRGEK